MMRVMVFKDHQWAPFDGDPFTTDLPRWVDIHAATEEEFQLLEHGFKFHPLAVEDCRHLDQRSKVEDYANHVFVVLHSYAENTKDPDALVLHELHLFLREDLVVTVHAEPSAALERVWTRANRAERSLCHDAGSILHGLADEMVDQMYPVMDGLDARLDDLHSALLAPRPDPSLMKRVLGIKQSVRDMRRLIGPLRDVLGTLTKVPIAGVTEVDMPYFRNVLDHLFVMQQQVELGREHVADVRDLYLTAQAVRTNEIVKRLTVMATLGLPITSITGFFGMNFEHLPFGNVNLMWGALAAMVLVPAGMVAFLMWRRWI